MKEPILKAVANPPKICGAVPPGSAELRDTVSADVYFYRNL